MPMSHSPAGRGAAGAAAADFLKANLDLKAWVRPKQLGVYMHRRVLRSSFGASYVPQHPARPPGAGLRHGAGLRRRGGIPRLSV